MPHITPKPDIPKPSQPINDEGRGILSNIRKTKPKGSENITVKEEPNPALIVILCILGVFSLGVSLGMFVGYHLI